MATVAVLLEVVDRHTGEILVPLEERTVEAHYEGEGAIFLEDRAKRSYLCEIEQRTKYEPRLRKILGSRIWRIDCTTLN